MSQTSYSSDPGSAVRGHGRAPSSRGLTCRNTCGSGEVVCPGPAGTLEPAFVLRPRSGRDGAQLDTGVLQNLLQPLDLTGARINLDLAVAGELAQLTNWWRWHVAGLDHAVGGHIGEPL